MPWFLVTVQSSSFASVLHLSSQHFPLFGRLAFALFDWKVPGSTRRTRVDEASGKWGMHGAVSNWVAVGRRSHLCGSHCKRIDFQDLMSA
jgi:hypothetical protein